MEVNSGATLQKWRNHLCAAAMRLFVKLRLITYYYYHCDCCWYHYCYCYFHCCSYYYYSYCVVRFAVKLNNGSAGTVEITAVEKLLTSASQSSSYFSWNWTANVLCTDFYLCTLICEARWSHKCDIMARFCNKWKIRRIWLDVRRSMANLFYTKLHHCRACHGVGNETPEKIVRWLCFRLVTDFH